MLLLLLDICLSNTHFACKIISTLSKGYLCYFLKAVLQIFSLLKISSVPTTDIFWGDNFSTAGSTHLSLWLVINNRSVFTGKSDVLIIPKGERAEEIWFTVISLGSWEWASRVLSRYRNRHPYCLAQWHLTAFHQVLNLIWTPGECLRNQLGPLWQTTC